MTFDAEALSAASETLSITPTHVRYLKCGKGGIWAEQALQHHYLPFGDAHVPHDSCVSRNWDEVRLYYQKYRGETTSPHVVSSDVREIQDFYELGRDCLWITFARGHLWWGFADPEVIWLGKNNQGSPVQIRKMTTPWRNTDLRDKPLRLEELSTRLTQVSAYKRTICKVKDADYLLRRIQGVEEPVLIKARTAREAMVNAASDMIQRLHQSDFETLSEMIFSRSGWQRQSRVGGTQKDVDFILQHPMTRNMIFVQVKSQATQRTLDDYIERFDADGTYDELYFICHSPNSVLKAPEERNEIQVWTCHKLADAVIRVGLFDWLMEKTV